MIENVQLQYNYGYWEGKNIPEYNENIFAFIWEGYVVEENISQERVFELAESFYTPENWNFRIQVWTGKKWENVL
jgi:hypothetical protein